MYRRSAAEKPRKDSAGFFDFGREKVSVWELSDDFGTAHGPFLLVGGTVVPRQPKRERLRSNAPKPFALYVKFGEVYASPSSFTRACAAARRAIGTRNGEQET